MLQQIKNRLRPFKAPKFCLDQATASRNGITITGWYASSKLRSISLVDQQRREVYSSIETHPREDVTAAYRMEATGFNIHCSTLNDLSGLYISFVSRRGSQKLYPVTNEKSSGASLGIKKDPLKDAVKSKHHDSQGHVDFSLLGDDVLFVNGWLASKSAYTSADLLLSEKVIASTEKAIIWTRRTDVESALKDKFSKSSCRGFLSSIKFPNTLSESEANKLTLRVNFVDHSIGLPIQSTQLLLENQKDSLIKALNGWNPLAAEHINGFTDVISPILSKLYRHDSQVSCKRVDFGKQPAQPKSTIIIPLYGRFDFLRYQISRFSRQKELRNHEILFVVDDPNIVEDVNALAGEVFEIFQFPFSVLSLEQNVGYGRANNIGVKHANSANLILLNSDIMPLTSHWADSLVSTLESEEVGIVGTRLLFEDQSIQHDGMAPMRIKEYPGILFNDHPRKGVDLELAPELPPTQECPLLTAACIALRKEDFEKVGGFEADYILGDFEDSDLCLKIIEIGKKNLIRRDLEIYHLERQSQNLVEPGDWKHKLTIYNALVYNQKWTSQIFTHFPEFMQVKNS
ncbi:glycosyltransferase family 2 protein [Microbulbifer sp. ALW1]|uniref:glycosyltransferase family 2 protein n=1 Tax=Microbulbifer sp. (strain ALW1) TaxID=1516059 RepID=UPI001356D9DF|nr:glycosyltransferase family 2 protein [Microbulbifer sp. ALW1]